MTSGCYPLGFIGTVSDRAEPEGSDSIPTRQVMLAHQPEVPRGMVLSPGILARN
ncbi:MAG: hypothetical protein GY924_09715 [Planctomycetaceae bacterium]|nr:hypothetical protein [Planctomycetaceae bacterium]